MSRPFAAAAERNSAAILGVLRREFLKSSYVLEIGSGTGQHAIAFATELSHLCWQPTDLVIHQASLRERVEHAGLPNVRAPQVLDVTESGALTPRYDGVFSANTAHIMGIAAVKRMFSLAAEALKDGGLFCLYGPFRLNGAFTTQSNADFDCSLREQDPDMGIRDLEKLDDYGRTAGLVRERLYAMPANNLLSVWRKRHA